MKDAASVIHKIIYEALDSAALVQVSFGKVTAEQPVEVQLEQKIFLNERQLIKPSEFKYELNDKLVMLRIQNDDRYLILGKL